ncbi:hypothetical protein DFH08DRAFT_905335 [Mycena albidolilacea]|uniref:Uncharacterized protein n=1 Tax=Mycena albidolilacea TaxID=1033008 RepID=A0AAD7E921_9AGAR|nr:hypothetical protein DFH08DRAFT_905335 [Mycena albidolilacea]
MPLSADTSCTATPFRPTFVASGTISSLALHIRLHTLSCPLSRLPRAVPPSFFSSSRRRHDQHRSWVSAVGVPPRLSVTSTYSRRARDPRTIPQSDYIRHRAPYDLQMGTSFDAHALPTARASVNLTAFLYVLLRTRVPVDRVSSMEYHTSPGYPKTSKVDFALVEVEMRKTCRQ